jgi:hypothetical protein
MLKSILLAGDVKIEDIGSEFLSRLESQVVKLSKFSQILILSNALNKSRFNPTSINVEIVKTPETTSGALATAGFGLSFLSENEPFLLVPSNAELAGNHVENFSKNMCVKKPAVGAIVFNGADPLFSYARLGKSGEIIEVVEKEVSGSCALAGFYYFSNKESFSSCLEWAMVNNIQNQGDFFISPALNYFLAKSLEISLYEIPTEDYLRF